MGAFDKGTRNSNGNCMVHFLEQSRTFVTNTQFQHDMKFRTTWSGIISQNGTENRYYNQIDYILVEQRYKDCVIDARSHNGCIFESDHALVVTRMRLSDICISVSRGQVRPESLWNRSTATATSRRTPSVGKTREVAELARGSRLQDLFHRRLQQILPSAEHTVNDHIQHLTFTITTAAYLTLPPKKKRYGGKVNYINDPALSQLSNERR